MHSIRQGLERAQALVIGAAQKNLQSQGKNATGKLSKSLEAVVKVEVDGLVGEIRFFKYGLFQDTGLQPSEIPFQSGSGKGSSKFIDALTKYVMIRGIETDIKRAKGLAFGIAKRQKKVGMPQRGGIFDVKRTGWFSKSVDENESLLQDVVQSAIFANFDEITDEVFDKI